MSCPDPRRPIPAPLWEKLDVFFQAKASGTIVMQVREGVVMSYEITDRGTIRNGQEPRQT